VVQDALACVQAADQQRVLGPLVTLSKSTCEETTVRILAGLYTLLELSGTTLSGGWVPILSMVTRGSGSNSSKVVKAAFECMQLVISDFLPGMPVEYCQTCILAVGQFRTRHGGVNVSLTAIGQLWHIADWIAGAQDSLVIALEAADDPVPVLVHQVSTLDGGAMVLDNEGGSFACPAPPATTSERPHLDRLWRTLFHQMQRGVDDPRPEVRKCAVQTLFSTLATHGSLFSELQWHEYLWQVVFPVLASIHAAALESRNVAPGDDDDSTVDTGLSLGANAPQMLIHHSRNTSPAAFLRVHFGICPVLTI
jgi:hypothetical protein